MTRCRKRRYPDRIVALVVLSKLEAKSSKKRQEGRAYECPRCSGWHLTSQPLAERNHHG